MEYQSSSTINIKPLLKERYAGYNNKTSKPFKKLKKYVYSAKNKPKNEQK